MTRWFDYSRSSIDMASTAASYGFTAVKAGTKFGFAVTRGVATTAVGITTTIVDHTLFGGATITRPVLGGAVASALSLAEQVALAPIFISEYITSTSLMAAHSSINVLSVIFPDSSEASFSLASFITLVKREWSDPQDGASLPEGQYGITQIARAIVAWVALQGVTQEWQERLWFKHLKEIHVRDPAPNLDSLRARRGSRIRVTSDVIFPGNYGQIVSADIGEVPVRAQSIFLGPDSIYGTVRQTNKRSSTIKSLPAEPPRLNNAELKSTLRRLSKMVLAGYGGASLLFFGVPLPSNPNPPTDPSAPPTAERASPAPPGVSSVPPKMSNSPQAKSEEAQLASAIVASEAEALGEAAPVIPAPATSYSWWDVLLGKHDHEIFENSAASYQTISRARSRFSLTGRGPRTKAPPITSASGKKMDVSIGREHMMPRFWVLSDHGRRQIVLVLRGTMSLNEIAVDLTCEPEDFIPASPSPEDEDEFPNTDTAPLPGRFVFPGAESSSRASSRSEKEKEGDKAAKHYEVHSGMLRMARAMGDPGRPVQTAVKEALFHNLDYELVLCGHSLGAGVAAILGLMWADPKSCLTVRSSGLPVGRRTSVYCFAPPSLTSAPLSQLSSSLITSFVYSHDVVSRLSIGSVRDLKNAAMWLCAEERNASTGTKQEREDNAGYSNVTARAKRWKNGNGKPGDEEWFMSVRKTLEANMQSSIMYPPGRVLWAMRDSDLHPVHRSPSSTSSRPEGKDKLRLFEVLDVEKVFKQIVFARDMLGAHMPHKYDSTLHDLL